MQLAIKAELLVNTVFNIVDQLNSKSDSVAKQFAIELTTAINKLIISRSSAREIISINPTKHYSALEASCRDGDIRKILKRLPSKSNYQNLVPLMNKTLEFVTNGHTNETKLSLTYRI